MGHVGYIYQATNFYYAGAAKAHDSEYLVKGKPVHPRTLASRGITDPKAWAKRNGYKEIKPLPKHRYVYVTGSRRARRLLLRSVVWPLNTKYPKGDPKRYTIRSKDIPKQIL